MGIYKQPTQILMQFYRAQNSSTQVDLCKKSNCGSPKFQSLTIQDTSKFISPYCINNIKYIHSLCTNKFKFIRQVLPKRENKQEAEPAGWHIVWLKTFSGHEYMNSFSALWWCQKVIKDTRRTGGNHCVAYLLARKTVNLPCCQGLIGV